MKPAILATCIVCAACVVALADGNIDPAEKFAWSETSGWVNFRPDHGGVTVDAQGYLSGYAWMERIGWVKLGSDGGGPYGNTGAGDWGVNMDSLWQLSGYAWSENAGWINVDPGQGGGVSVDQDTGAFDGYAWAERLGWMRFRNVAVPYGVRRVVTLTANGLPYWWLELHGWTTDHEYWSQEDFDGDMFFAKDEREAGTDPRESNSVFSVRSVEVTDDGDVVSFGDIVEGREYALWVRSDLMTGSWSVVESNLLFEPTLAVYTNPPTGAAQGNYRATVQRR